MAMQTVEEQDDQIEELETSAKTLEEQLEDANRSVKQHAASMEKVCA